MLLVSAVVTMTIMPITAVVIIAMTGDRSADDRSACGSDDCTDGAADGRSGRASHNSSTDRVFASRRTGRCAEGNGKRG